MRPWIYTLPLICFVVGCDTQQSPVAQADNAAPAASPTLLAAATAPAKPATKPSNADPAYHVVDVDSEFGASSNPEVTALKAALKHVQVAPPAKTPAAPAAAKVQLVTSKGTITLELNGKEAPLHVKSFLHLAKMGFYDKTVFHRFADLMGGGKGRIIQGGDPFTKVPTTRDKAGQGGPGYTVPREKNSLTHVAMVIAAARSNDPNSAGSQFYLTLDPTLFLDEGDGYTVFGKVIGGKDVVLKMAQDDVLKKVNILK